jgi:metal transporter CNNM
MTPIEDVFMLSIESKLDYDLLKQIVATGHSRIPVYEEIDAPVAARVVDGVKPAATPGKVKKILGILLVKQLVLLDPKGKCIPTFFNRILTQTPRRCTVAHCPP